MPPVVYLTTSLVELERFMAGELCSRERLDPEQVKLKRSLVRRGKEVVGLVVRVESTRLMRLHAIWVEGEDRILFYDSAGQRFAVVILAEAPELGLLVA